MNFQETNGSKHPPRYLYIEIGDNYTKSYRRKNFFSNIN